jgi:NAD-dependent SIR2 family protein deacetylase
MIRPDPNRAKPYADLSRMACAHCRASAASHNWSVTVCANGRRRIEVPVCEECDVEFNRHTLEFINHPAADELLARYREQMA